jgi:hypothetical protein
LVPHPEARLPQGTPSLTSDTFFFSFGAFITALCIFHLVTFGIVGNLFPVKKLFLTATFDGILPKETRQKAIHARGHFDNLYLVVDQQNRWKSELLPDPASALLDPLLIGEKRERSGSSYFLIDQFASPTHGGCWRAWNLVQKSVKGSFRYRRGSAPIRSGCGIACSRRELCTYLELGQRTSLMPYLEHSAS